MAVNPVAERASNIRGGIELPLILGNVAAVKGWILPVLYELSQLKWRYIQWEPADTNTQPA